MVNKNEFKHLKVLLLNSPCNGFGDLVCASKFARILRKKLFVGQVHIATTQPKKLLSAKEKRKNVKTLKSKRASDTNCRRFGLLKGVGLQRRYDVIFVVPLSLDFDVNYSDVKKLIPYSNKENTYFVSEYQDFLDKHFTFNLGIGKGYDGIIIDRKKPKPYKHPHKYAFSYCAATSDVPHWRRCIRSFVQLCAKKYQKNKIFDIMGTERSLKYIIQLPKRKLRSYYGKFFGTLIYRDKQKEQKIILNHHKRNTLVLRADIYPVRHTIVKRLIKRSVEDILLTGDQSLSDALSCCPTKNIWYQHVPWKDSFIKQLAKLMPNKYLRSVKTSCGTLRAIHFKSNYHKFIKEYDFFKRSKGKLLKILRKANKRKKNKKKS